MKFDDQDFDPEAEGDTARRPAIRSVQQLGGLPQSESSKLIAAQQADGGMKAAATEPNMQTFGAFNPRAEAILKSEESHESQPEVDPGAMDTIPLPEVFGVGIRNIEDVNFNCDTKDPSKYAATEKCEEDVEMRDYEEQ